MQIQQRIDNLITRMRDEIPTEVDNSVLENMDNLIKGINQKKDYANPLAKAEYIRKLHGILLIFRKVIIPTIARAEMDKLKFIANAAAELQTIDPKEVNTELQKIGTIGKSQVEQLQALASLVSELAKNG